MKNQKGRVLREIGFEFWSQGIKFRVIGYKEAGYDKVLCEEVEPIEIGTNEDDFSSHYSGEF